VSKKKERELPVLLLAMFVIHLHNKKNVCNSSSQQNWTKKHWNFTLFLPISTVVDFAGNT
jgi:hypothetical protein